MSDFLFEHDTDNQVSIAKVEKDTHRVVSETKVATITTTVDIKDKQPCCPTGNQDDLTQLKNLLPKYEGVELDPTGSGYQQMLALIEGSPWPVLYFQQYLGADDEPSAFSEERLVAYQQYRGIKDFELRVTDSLSYNYEQEIAMDELTGSANVYPVLHPNVGDMFIVGIGDGRLGLFEIDAVRKQSHRKHSAFVIEYHVRQYVDDAILGKLNEKVIDWYRFDKQRLLDGLNPFVEEKEFDALRCIETEMHRLTNSYFNWFFDEESNSLTVPTGEACRTYDIGQVKFVDSIVDKLHYPKYRQIRLQLAESEGSIKTTTLWDALLYQDLHVIDDADTKFSIMSARNLKGPSLMFNAYYGIYQYFIVSRHYENHDHIDFRYLPRYTAPAELPLFTEEDTTQNKRYIYQVGLNQDYVFSHYFYLGEENNMSRLERLVYQFLKHCPVCPDELLRLMRAAPRWDDLDRYYYIPVLLLLGQALVNGRQ